MISQKTRLRKRLGWYRSNPTWFVKLLESDFRGIFSQMLREKNPDYDYKEFWKEVDKMIDNLTEEECIHLNMRWDCYNIDSRVRK